MGRDSDLAADSIALLSQAQQSANLRRLIMLAVDTDSIVPTSSRGHRLERGIEILLPT